MLGVTNQLHEVHIRHQNHPTVTFPPSQGSRVQNSPGVQGHTYPNPNHGLQSSHYSWHAQPVCTEDTVLAITTYLCEKAIYTKG